MAEGGFDLGKQVGPLPLGGWIAIVAGGLGLGYLINRSQARREAEPVEVADSDIGRGGMQLIESPPATLAPPIAPDETNATWGIKAVNYLIGNNLANPPSMADQAVRKYLQTETLSLQERALIDLVLLRFGAPPEPLPPAQQVPPTPTPPPRTPVPPPTPPVVGIRWTQLPRNPVGRRPFSMRGNLTYNRRPAAAKIVRFEWTRRGQPWRFQAYVGTNSRGDFVFTHPGIGATADFRAVHRGVSTPRFNARLR